MLLLLDTHFFAEQFDLAENLINVIFVHFLNLIVNVFLNFVKYRGSQPFFELRTVNDSIFFLQTIKLLGGPFWVSLFYKLPHLVNFFSDQNKISQTNLRILADQWLGNTGLVFQ